jgi:hypothetical protein
VSGGARMPIAGEEDAYHPFSVPEAMIEPLRQIAATETSIETRRGALMVCDWVGNNNARRTANRSRE